MATLIVADIDPSTPIVAGELLEYIQSLFPDVACTTELALESQWAVMEDRHFYIDCVSTCLIEVVLHYDYSWRVRIPLVASREDWALSFALADAVARLKPSWSVQSDEGDDLSEEGELRENFIANALDSLTADRVRELIDKTDGPLTVAGPTTTASVGPVTIATCESENVLSFSEALARQLRRVFYTAAEYPLLSLVEPVNEAVERVAGPLTRVVQVARLEPETNYVLRSCDYVCLSAAGSSVVNNDTCLKFDGSLRQALGAYCECLDDVAVIVHSVSVVDWEALLVRVHKHAVKL